MDLTLTLALHGIRPPITHHTLATYLPTRALVSYMQCVLQLPILVGRVITRDSSR